ncbi:DNA repair protein XRCC3 X-ray repair cross-complementing protein 3 [Channa argus]|uniref:DNA repair protein XRCC3 X-ray repair cross-complementing protein 3 n=1 Tax=Channa argus TaxID=215402 RepID=A0A6G1QLV5_CHAAH|nr:DNA repair protein XRCC3 X-ray repair cross-complementing protein 3 [Channa argus]
MNWDQLELNPRIIVAVKRAKLKSISEVLCVSGSDLQRLTGLSHSDVQHLLTAVSTTCRRHPPTPVILLLHNQESNLKLSLGCRILDQLLRGGLPVVGVTELSGESGAGKTQLALQLCLSVQYPTQYGGLNSGAVYVCTEDLFPIRRLQQLIQEQTNLRTDVPTDIIHSLRFSDSIYIEHAADLESLQVCLSRRIPLLLARGLVRLLIVDSVAALFRSEFQASDWLERNKQMLAFSSALHHLSREFTTPVLCINQVSDVFSGSDDTLGPRSSTVAPALGLAWANQLMVRLMFLRLQRTVARGDQTSAVRRLEVMFAPHLAREGQDAGIWREGVQAYDIETMPGSIPLSLLLLLFLLGPVSSETVNPMVQDLISRNADFATQLYRAVASRTDDNVLLSPFTISVGLLALLSASNGATRDQLVQGLTMTGLDPQALPGKSRM